MTRGNLAVAILAVTWLALPARGEGAGAATIRIRQLGTHDAARFLAEVHRVNLLAIGADKPCTLELKSTSVEKALGELAAAQGLALRKRGALYLLGPAALLKPEGAVTGLKGGRRVDLSFKLAEVAAVAKLLGDVAMLKLEGELRGRVTIVARSLPSVDVLAALLELASGSARREKGVVRVTPRSGLATTAPPGSGSCPPLVGSSRVHLSCAPVSELRVGAIAASGTRTWASLFRPSGEGSDAAVTVRVGDRVGRSEGDGQPRRILAIDEKGVALEAERRLPFP